MGLPFGTLLCRGFRDETAPFIVSGVGVKEAFGASEIVGCGDLYITRGLDISLNRIRIVNWKLD